MLRSAATTALIVLTFSSLWPNYQQWYSRSDIDSPPAVQVGISAGVPHDPPTTCWLCWLAENRAKIETLCAVAEWVDAKAKKYTQSEATRKNFPCSKFMHRDTVTSTQTDIHASAHRYSTNTHLHAPTLHQSARAEAQLVSAWGGELRLNRWPL